MGYFIYFLRDRTKYKNLCLEAMNSNHKTIKILMRKLLKWYFVILKKIRNQESRSLMQMLIYWLS